MKLEELRELVITKLIVEFSYSRKIAESLAKYDSDRIARRMYISFLKSNNY